MSSPPMSGVSSDGVDSSVLSEDSALSEASEGSLEIAEELLSSSEGSERLEVGEIEDSGEETTS